MPHTRAARARCVGRGARKDGGVRSSSGWPRLGEGEEAMSATLIAAPSLDPRDPLEASWGIDSSAIVQPEILLPDQVESLRSRERGGPRALMLAVLEEAILCIRGADRGRAADAREASRARRWVRSRDQSWLFSFENVCAALDIDASALRSSLLASPPAKLGLPGASSSRQSPRAA